MIILPGYQRTEHGKARFRSFLFSKSVPIKATIYEEWHDSRIVPWKHFIPLDNAFAGIWPISEYFFGKCVSALGQEGGKMSRCKAHDIEARDIAYSGAEWAQKVLRKDDMLLYLMRLLMEYGRIIRVDRTEHNERDHCVS
jgi:hypothetical protein